MGLGKPFYRSMGKLEKGMDRAIRCESVPLTALLGMRESEAALLNKKLMCATLLDDDADVRS